MLPKLLSGLVLMLCIGMPQSGACQGQTSRGEQPASRIIQLDLVADPSGQPGMQQEWMEKLNDCGIDRVRITTSRVSGRPSIEELESGSIVVIKIAGTLDDRKILLPGRTFTIGEVDGIRAWVQQLRDDGAAVALGEKMGFGLTSEQLVALHTELSTPLDASTSGQSPAAILQQIRGKLKTPIVAGPAVAELLANDEEKFSGELQGFSAGTALAALVRPLGLVVVPDRPQGGTLQITLVPGENAAEHWPVGWPTEGPTNQIEPRLFERIDVEIRAFRLDDALQAISGRIGVAILYDYNSLAEKELDPAQALVTLVKPKQTYYSIVTALCSKTKPRLAASLRVDENGKPFFWVF